MENTAMNIVTHDIDIATATAPAALMHRESPTAEVEKRFSDALAYLVFRWSFFAQMIYSGMEMAYTKDVPIAATDSYTIFIHPEGFIENDITDVLEIVFVLAHEVLHRVFNDMVMGMVWRATGQVLCPNGPLPYDDDLMNQAMDYRINAVLVHAKLGKMPKVGLYDPMISQQGLESVVEIYEKLYKAGDKGPGKRPGNQPGAGGRPGQKPGNQTQPGGFDIHLEPTPQQVQKDKGKREQEIITAGQIAERTNPGSMPAAISRVLGDILDPVVPWEQHLKSTMQRKAGIPRLDWRYQNRRLAGREPPMFYAKKGHKGAGTIVVGGDNSGSIGQAQIDRFASEMTGIVADLNPERLVIIWCDAAVSRVDILDEPEDLVPLFADWKKAGVGGGGGTDFCPVFAKIEEMGLEPDMLVYFTDGEGSFPSVVPDYPVIWASIKETSRYPFGEVVDVKV